MKLNTKGASQKQNWLGKAVNGKNSFSFSGQRFDKEGKLVEQKQFTFRSADLPDDLPDNFVVENGKNYLFRTTADGKLDGIRRAAGTYEVRVRGFSTKDDGQYFVQEKQNEYGTSYSCVIDLLVISELKKGGASDTLSGVIYPFYLPLGNNRKMYLTVQDGLLSFDGNIEKSKPAAKLYEFLMLTGLAEKDIRVGDDADIQDILDAMEKALKRIKPILLMTAKNGYPETLSSIDDDDDKEKEENDVAETEEVTDEMDEDEEEQTPKRKSRPALPSDDDE